MQELKREINALENKLAVEKAATEAERRRNNALLEQQQNTDEESRYSPTLSIGQESISSASSAWPAVCINVITIVGLINHIYISIINNFLFFSLMIQYLIIVLEDFLQCLTKASEQAQAVRQSLKIYKHN